MNARNRFAIVLGLMALLTLPADAQERRVRRARLAPSTHRIDYGSTRVWVPGHYETRFERVFVPGCERRIWVPPRYEWRTLPCGGTERVLVEPGHYRVVRDPGRYERRERRVWVPGHYEYRPRYRGRRIRRG